MLGARGTGNRGRSLKVQALRFVLALCALWLLAPIYSAFAAENSANSPVNTQSETPIDIEKILIAELEPDFTVVLEGKALNAEVSRDSNSAYLVRAEPIFKALNDEFEYNVDDGTLVVKRSQDGVIMELYTNTGIVKANGKALGRLKKFGQVDENKINLTPNAIAVLSGAIGKLDKNNKQINFELDPRLKVSTGFDIFVNDIALGSLDPGPKAIGSVMLLPLRPIAKELGHDVRVIESGSTVEVRRAQDSAIFTLDLQTGLVKLNGRPVGVSKDVTYIDPVNLLLPIGAIETLTGTHINVTPGSDRIDIELDDRLKGAIKPGANILEQAKNTPFKLETLDFHVGTDTINTANLDFHVKGINGRVRYEVPDLPTKGAEARPSWLSLNYVHVNGASGAIGDYAADLRELDGVGLRRIRGVSLVKSSENGRVAIAAGVPVSGSKKISKDQSRLEYSGFAAGVRYADKKGWEAGIAYKADGLSDDQMAVLTAISGRLGRKRDKKLNWDVQANLGAFKGNSREKTVDFQVNSGARYSFSNHVDVDAYGSYSGAEFLRTDLNQEARQAQIAAHTTTSNGDTPRSSEQSPDIRTRGLDMASLGANVRFAAKQNVGILKNPAISVRYNANLSGVLTKSPDASTLHTYGVGVNTGVKSLGTQINIDLAGYQHKKPDGTHENGNSLTAQIFQDVKYATIRGKFESRREGVKPREETISAQLNAKPWRFGLPKDGKFSVAPSVTGAWNERNSYIRGGVLANLDAGNLLGEKTKLQASMGILQNVTGAGEQTSDKFLSVSVGRMLRLNKNMALGVSYRNNLDGDQRVGVFLDGRFGFNEKRRFTKAVDGRGVLKGRAFYDKNRDGIKQDDEQGIPGAIVRIKGTRLALRTDGLGYYTIQNIKEGLHTVLIDGESLPLGYLLDEKAETKATIVAGHVTDVPLPVVQRGQILGFAYIDGNGDGEYTKGEKRLEGAKMRLTSLEDKSKVFEVYSASFGQFAFDDLPGGKYEMQVLKTNSTLAEAGKAIIIDLDKAEDHMARINIGTVSAKSPVKSVNEDSVSNGMKGRKPEIPAPDIIENGPAP